jgi:lipopolysaccharide transport system ATP-binding protein
MSNEILIEAENISKKFCLDLKQSLVYGMQDIGRELLGRKHNDTLREKEFWAVENISFEVRRGECLGLIGRNGAGKSTLLKMLNGLIRPDKGRITMKGRIGALIELGTGFNPVLTGRENIYNNGAVLGFTRKEIDKKFDEIVAFSEIEQFLDTPVQNYSSGMKVRLGFAVASQMEPDILLIDEVLAVGDMGFVLKCFNRMDQLRSKTAMIYVSHNMPQVSRICTEVCLLNRGQNAFQSKIVKEGITKYYELFKQDIGDFKGSDKATLEKISLHTDAADSETGKVFLIKHGEDLRIRISVNCKETIHNPHIYLAFYDKDQRNFAEALNFGEFSRPDSVTGLVTLEATIPKIPFSHGLFSITVSLSETRENERKVLFRLQSAISFNVESQYHGWASVELNPSWTLLSDK